MIAVAIAGLVMGGAIGGVRLKQRRDYFLAREQDHALSASVFRECLPNALRFLEKRADLQGRTKLKRLRADLPKEIAYQEALARKYRHAARYPWLIGRARSAEVVVTRLDHSWRRYPGAGDDADGRGVSLHLL
jgi:hypothetical protein